MPPVTRMAALWALPLPAEGWTLRERWPVKTLLWLATLVRVAVFAVQSEVALAPMSPSGMRVRGTRVSWFSSSITSSRRPKASVGVR